MKVNFKKMNGLGNDFVVIDVRQNPIEWTQDRIRLISDRRLGIGCDQLILIENDPSGKADVFMRIYNLDGSEPESCGNATRCVASLIIREKGGDGCTINTLGGLLPCRELDNEMVEVTWPAPKLSWDQIPLSKDTDTLHMEIGEGDVKDPVGVNIGNPHAVFFVNDADNVDVAGLGPRFENDPLFPEKANIEFAHIISDTKIRMRVWERGSGITMACGSAAYATAIAAVRRNLAQREVEIVLDGGSLFFHWLEDNGDNTGKVLMTGPVTQVFDGIYELH